MRRPGIQARFTLAIAGTVTIAVLVLTIVVGAFGAWMLHSNQDLALQREAARVANLINAHADWVASGYCEYAASPACTLVITADTIPGPSELGIPVTPEQLVLTGDQTVHDTREALWSEAIIGAVPVRVITVPLDGDRALITASASDLVQRSINRLNLILIITGSFTVLGAALVSHLVAGRTVRPVLALTRAAEGIVSAGDADRRVALPRDDEVGRLATAIDDMLTRLDRSESARRDLISDASHDLRSPLTALSTNLELLGRITLPDGVRERLLADIRHEAGDMAKLVDDITELAKAESSQPTARELSPSGLVAEAVGIAQRRWQGTHFETDSHFDAERTSTGSPELLVRAVVNLLDNAAKYGQADGTVSVAAGDDDHGWWISVHDEGAGIPADELPRVFERYYRATSTVRESGSGIGLAMAQQTAERHGGSLTATSALGEGTTLTLAIPHHR